jgi:periplasmic protein TonB
MFESAMLSNTGRTQKGWTVVLSFAGQMLLVSAAIFATVLHSEKLPKVLPSLGGLLLAPTPEPPVPARPKLSRTTGTAARVPGVFRLPQQITPLSAMKDSPGVIAFVEELPDTGTMGHPSSGGGSVADLRLGPAVVPPPPPPAAPKREPEAKPTARIRIGGEVAEAKVIRRVLPVYPVLAKQARIQGTVELVGIISTDGTIQNLQVVSGHPLLVPAAVDAVRQWLYQPTRLNGQPVEVVAPIRVHFSLHQ